MGGKTALVYSDEFMKYDFGPTHPLRAIRLRLAFELIRETGLLNSPSVTLLQPRQATESELLMVHSKEYIKEVKRLSKIGVGYLDLGDTPAFKGIHEAAATAVGGSIVAVDSIMKGKTLHSFNIAGGLHHAGTGHAAGFCVYNDIAVAIRYIQHNYGIQKVALVDLDVHHGDGTQEIFYEDPSVLIIDFHEDGKFLYPGSGFTNEMGEGKGRGYKINVPLPPLTSSEPYLHAFDEIALPVLRAFKPEIIVNQFGVDTHFTDPLAHLCLRMETYDELASRLHSISHEVSEGRYLVVGGGGYRPENVARAWAIVFSRISEYPLPEEIPSRWIDLCREVMKREPPKIFLDRHENSTSSTDRERIRETVKLRIKDVKNAVFSIHAIGQ